MPEILTGLPTLGDSPVEVWLEFICRRPKKPTRPYSVGDGDNYAKAAFDARTSAKLWDDDVQVVTTHLMKPYAHLGEEPQYPGCSRSP